jgi:hypothetical protein
MTELLMNNTFKTMSCFEELPRETEESHEKLQSEEPVSRTRLECGNSRINSRSTNHSIVLSVAILLQIWPPLLQLSSVLKRCEVLTAFRMMLALSWLLAPYGFVDRCQRFRETCCLHIQG